MQQHKQQQHLLNIWLFCSCFIACCFAQVTVPVPTFVVNLDLPAAQRWPWYEFIPRYNQSVHEALAMISDFIPEVFQPEVEGFALLTLPHLGQYADEIQSGALAFGMDLGKATLLNIIYEVEAGCTSIVAQNTVGTIFHGRNLDFDLAQILRKLTVKIEFQSGGKTKYYGTTYVGYVGLLTGMRPGSFAISLDQRHIGYAVENLLESLIVRGTYCSCFLIRDTLNNFEKFSDAVNNLAYQPIAAPAYIIVSGTQPGEGTVITRDRNGPDDIWTLNPNFTSGKNWFLVETNYDHWKNDTDPRRKAATQGMIEMGQKNLDLDGLFQVLSIRPVMNDGTTYTTLMSATTGNFTTFAREL